MKWRKMKNNSYLTTHAKSGDRRARRAVALAETPLKAEAPYVTTVIVGLCGIALVTLPEIGWVIMGLSVFGLMYSGDIASWINTARRGWRRRRLVKMQQRGRVVTLGRGLEELWLEALSACELPSRPLSGQSWEFLQRIERLDTLARSARTSPRDHERLRCGIKFLMVREVTMGADDFAHTLRIESAIAEAEGEL
jgi:hypothetical protein